MKKTAFIGALAISIAIGTDKTSISQSTRTEPASIIDSFKAFENNGGKLGPFGESVIHKMDNEGAEGLISRLLLSDKGKKFLQECLERMRLMRGSC